MDDVRALFGRALDWFGTNVHAVADDQWRLPTPCSEWDVRELVNHLVGETRWMPPLLEGKTIAAAGEALDGDLLGGDPNGAWDDAAREAVTAVREDGAMDRAVHLSFGDFPGSEYAFQVLTDLLIHGWDLARAIGAEDRMDPELVEVVDERSRPVMPAMKASGQFGSDVAPPQGADRQTALLAMFGRTV